MRALLPLVVLAVGTLVPIGCKDPPPKANVDPATSASSAPSAPAPPTDRFPLTDEQIAAIINPKGATEYTGPTGVIEGVVKVKGDPPAIKTFIPMPKGCENAKDVHAAAYRAGSGGELADVLVGVIGVSGFVRPSRDDKHIAIKNCSVEPTVIDLSLGQRLMVSNEDSIQPYMPQVSAKMIVQRLAIKGSSPVPMMLTSPGAYGFTWLAGALPGSNVPQATIFVLPSALHQVTSLDGKFRITGVPVGPARVTASHLGMPEAFTDVEVKAGEELKVSLTMTYKAPPPAASASGSASAPKPHSSIH